MPVNRKALDRHLQELKATPEAGLNRRTLTRSLKATQGFVSDIAIPNGESTPKTETDFSALARQSRHNLLAEIEQLQYQTERLSFSNASALTEPEKVFARTILKEHQSLIRAVEGLALHDIDPIRILPWEQTEAGRKSLARQTVMAQETFGNRPSDAQPAIRAGMASDFLANYPNYLDQELPGNQSDNVRLTLSLRETLVLAEQMHWALTAGSSQSLQTETLARQLTTALSQGQNELRYNLPAIEGIATPEFWQAEIESGFSGQGLVPDYEPLLQTQLQDHLSIPNVLRTMAATIRPYEWTPENAAVLYLDEMTDDEAIQRLSMLGKTDDKLVYVLAAPSGHPLLLTARSTELPGFAILTAPDKRHQTLYLDLPTFNETNPQANSRALNDLIESLAHTAEALEPNVPPEVTKKDIETLHAQWQSLVSRADVSTPATLQSELQELNRRISKTATQIIAPGAHEGPAHRANAKALTRLALLAANEGSEYHRLRFRTPTGTNTRASQKAPQVVLENEQTNEQGLSSVQFGTLDAQGAPTGAVIGQLHNIPSSKRASTITLAAAKLTPDTREVAKQAPDFPGYITFAGSARNLPYPTGHYLPESERRTLTEFSPMGLTHRDASGNPLFEPQANRSLQDVQALKDATVYLLHKTSISPIEAGWAAEMASYDGDYMLQVDMEDLVGSPKIQIHEAIFQECTLEDIKRHLLQKVILSGHNPSASEQILNSVRETSWDEAEGAMAYALDEAASVLDGPSF